MASPDAPAPPAGRAVVLPHLGMGDMLVLRGLVAALCARYDALVVVGLRRYRDSLGCLFEDLAPRVSVALVDSARDISPRFGASGKTLAAYEARGYEVLALGDHGAEARWREAHPLWTRALYAQAGVDPAHMYAGFRLPASRAAQSRAMLATVRELTGGRPYVLVHDDERRPLWLPPDLGPDDPVVLHVDDARLRSAVVFDYVDTLRHAARLHAIDSCFALLADLAGLDTPVTVHAYAKNAGMEDIYRDGGRVSILRRPPTPALYGAHAVPLDDACGRALHANFRHFVALQGLMAPTREEWHPCGSYLMGPASMDYEPRMHAKQALLFEHARGRRNVLEIGVHGGHSLLLTLLAAPQAHVTCVDLCAWSHTARCVAYLQSQFPGRVTLLRGSSRDVLPLVQGVFDLVHVDGDHSYEGAKFDMEHAHRLSAPDTVFVFDDYYDGIARAVDELGHLFELVDVPMCSWTNCLLRRRDHV